MRKALKECLTLMSFARQLLDSLSAGFSAPISLSTSCGASRGVVLHAAFSTARNMSESTALIMFSLGIFSSNSRGSAVGLTADSSCHPKVAAYRLANASAKGRSRLPFSRISNQFPSGWFSLHGRSMTTDRISRTCGIRKSSPASKSWSESYFVTGAPLHRQFVGYRFRKLPKNYDGAVRKCEPFPSESSGPFACEMLLW